MSAAKILVPVDLDDGSKAALEHAFSFAARLGAEVHVLHVWEPPKLVRPDLMVYLDANGQTVSLAEFTQNRARADLGQLLEETTPEHTTTQALVVLGRAATQIVDTARQGDYDMIVMATRGRRGVSHALLGSVAEKVVRLAPCPVLVIPPRAPTSG